ncbi:MAG: DUF4325 domain-containing protein [bacterium]
MTTKEKALEILSEQKRLTTRDIMSACKISRQSANLVVKELAKEGKIIKITSMPAIYTFPQDKDSFKIKIKKRLRNKSLKEHEILSLIKSQLPILFQLPENVRSVFDYAFSEMLNNAIEHSKSNFIEIEAEKNKKYISFVVNDFGIGVFRNIMKKRNLRLELEAIQDLLKGKITTQPRAHSGEGIFFTSKAADVFVLESFGYRLRVDNIINDIFVEEFKSLEQGTKVIFSIEKKSKKHLNNIFMEYQADLTELGFDKTEVKVKLFTMGTIYISRSQARRVVAGLNKFKSIILDFDKVPTVGQAFADEVFRVFAQNHPRIKIQAINTSKAVQFMIDRVDNRITNIKERTGSLFDVNKSENSE